MNARDTTTRPLSPHEYAVAWHLGQFTTWPAEDASAEDIYEQGFRHGRPSYQRWSPRKVATVLVSLRRRGLVTDSGATDERLPGHPTRRWRLTDKGERWLNP